jgi:hypothetical protein
MEYVRCAFNEPCELCLVVYFYMNLVLILYASEYLISVPIFYHYYIHVVLLVTLSASRTVGLANT